jgi:RNA polymerase sigma factor (sigma-70 family)
MVSVLPLSDDALLVATAAGDGDAVAVFYRRHVDTVVAFLRARVGDQELVLDLVAETFAAVIESAPRYRAGEAPAVVWVLGIARHKLLMSLRRGRVEMVARQRLGMERLMVTDDDLDEVEERSARGALALDELLAELPEDTMRSVVARVVEERTYDDIAAELRCSQAVVRQRVHRGLGRLRARLEERP